MPSAKSGAPRSEQLKTSVKNRQPLKSQPQELCDFRAERRDTTVSESAEISSPLRSFIDQNELAFKRREMISAAYMPYSENNLMIDDYSFCLLNS
jgi:hypothetical protein